MEKENKAIEKNEYDGFYFFRSYCSAYRKFKSAGDTEAAAFIACSIIDYMFFNEEPEEIKRVELSAIWDVLKPNLDSSKKIESKKKINQINGSKGGKKRVENQAKAQANVQAKTQANTQAKSKQYSKQNKDRNKDRNMDRNMDRKTSSYDDEELPNPFLDDSETELAVECVTFVDGQPQDSEIKISPPTEREVSEYIIEMGFTPYVNEQRFCNYYGERHWIDGRGCPFDWKLKINEWAAAERMKMEQRKLNG